MIMKKWLALILALAMSLALCACGGGDTGEYGIFHGWMFLSARVANTDVKIKK